MSAARAPRVHFTYHPCLVAHPTGETWRSAPFDARSWVFCSYPYTSWSSAERDGTRSSLRFTTESKKVTCRTCRSEIVREPRQSARSPHVSHPELIGLPWLRCCRHHGAPAPWSPAETARILARRKVEARLQPLSVLDQAAHSLVHFSLLEHHHEGDLPHDGAPWRRLCEAVVEKCDEALREALRPAISEFLCAADVADVVAERVASGARLLGEVQERVRAGEIAIVHGDPFADVDHPRHRAVGALLTSAPTATNRDPRAVS
jgi:hypothetical protein